MGAGEVERLWAAAEARRGEFVRDFAARVRLPYLVAEEAYEIPFLLRDLWTDGTFTYLRTEGQEIPAVYAFRGDALEAVHTDVEPGGLLVVEQVIRHGTLRLGGTRGVVRAVGRGRGDAAGPRRLLQEDLCAAAPDVRGLAGGRRRRRGVPCREVSSCVRLSLRRC